jgi:hypothetical protein
MFLENIMRRQKGWLSVLQVIEKIKMCLPWSYVLSEGISQKMIGERKLLIIWKIHLERFLGSSGIKP